MKKITWILLFFISCFSFGYAQVSSYSFAQSNDTYVEITGGTILGTSTTATSFDSQVWTIADGSIPFNFNFNGTDYTGCKVTSNGFITFGTTAPSTTLYTPISSTTAYNGAVSAWGADLCGVFVTGLITGEARWEVVGSAPNREFVIQFKNWRPAYSSSTTNIPYINFQIRLVETSNLIKVVYGSNGYAAGSTSSSGTRQIGLRGATNTDYNNRLNNTSTLFTASTAGTANSSTQAYNTTVATPGMPTDGLTYTWTPPTPCTGTPVAGTSAPVSQTLISGQASATLTITGQTTGVSGLSYQWEQSTDSGSNWANAVGGTGATTLSYTPPVYAGTPIQYRLKITCTASGLFDYSSVASIVSCGAVTSLPWTENFDGLTTLGTTNFPSCWFKEIGDWSSSNATTYNTARSGANYIRNAWSSTNEYIWTVGFDLTAGTSYDFSTFVQGDGGTGWVVDMFYNTSASSVGATQLGGSYNVPGTGTIAIQSYAEVKRTFVPSSSGTYYFAVRVNQPSSSPWYVAFDDFKLELTPACPSPSGLTVNSITDASASITWTATSGNYQYVIDQVAADPAGAGTNLAGETYDAPSLNPLTTYYFHVRTDCGSGTYSTWSTISFTTLATPPANDDCINAIALTPGGVYSDNPVDGTNAGASTSSQTAPTTCFGFSGGDVWYSVVVPASGNITIETGTPVGGGTGIDTVITAYSGDCAFPTQVGCDDDGAAEFAVGFSKLSLTGQTPGMTIFIRAYEYSNDAAGSFGISAYDASLSTGSFDSASFKAYPNPVKDMLNLSYSSDITSVEVYNMLGQNVMTKALNASQGQIDLSNLNAGNYIVKVTADGLVKTIKVVKQ